MGKTHLLGAIGHQVLAVNPSAQIEFLTLDEFVEAFHAALVTGRSDAYRARFAASRPAAAGRHPVPEPAAGDAGGTAAGARRDARGAEAGGAHQRPRRPARSSRSTTGCSRASPAAWSSTSRRPTTRPGSRSCAARRRSAGRRFPDGVLEAVASLGIESVRELIGALNRLVAFQAVSEAPIDAAQARLLIGGPQAAVVADELVLDQAESLEFAAAGHPETGARGGRDPPRDGGRPAGRDAGAVGHAGRCGGRAAAARPGRAGSEPPDFGLPGEAHEFSDVRESAGPRVPGAPDQLNEGLAGKPALQADRDEFGDFLSDLAATLARQVDPWRARVGEAILRWEGEGFRTYRLERLLEDPEPPDPESVMIQYEADAEQLLELRAEAESLAPEMASAAQLTDPGNMAAAEAYMQRVREGAVPPAGPVEHWQLDDLIEGPGNRMAVRAALAAIAEPGHKYNPIVVVGGSGVGKTHLLHGIGNAPGARERRARGVPQCARLHPGTDRGDRPRRRHRVAQPLPPLLGAAARRRAPHRGEGAHAGGAVPALQPLPRVEPAAGLHLGGAAGGAVGRRAAPADPPRGRAGGGTAAARPGAAPAAGGADAGGARPGGGRGAGRPTSRRARPNRRARCRATCSGCCTRPTRSRPGRPRRSRARCSKAARARCGRAPGRAARSACRWPRRAA